MLKVTAPDDLEVRVLAICCPQELAREVKLGSRLMSVLEPQSSPHALKGVRVLLVDDNAFNREIASTLLERVGVVVTVACGGREALEIVEHNEFDAVLMDCLMPAMDGYATTRALRALPRLASLPVIAMTADSEAAGSGKTLGAGMNDHVRKPIEVNDLYSALSRWVRRNEIPDSTP